MKTINTKKVAKLLSKQFNFPKKFSERLAEIMPKSYSFIEFDWNYFEEMYVRVNEFMSMIRNEVPETAKQPRDYSNIGDIESMPLYEYCVLNRHCTNPAMPGSDPIYIMISWIKNPAHVMYLAYALASIFIDKEDYEYYISSESDCSHSIFLEHELITPNREYLKESVQFVIDELIPAMEWEINDDISNTISYNITHEYDKMCISVFVSGSVFSNMYKQKSERSNNENNVAKLLIRQFDYTTEEAYAILDNLPSQQYCFLHVDYNNTAFINNTVRDIRGFISRMNTSLLRNIPGCDVYSPTTSWIKNPLDIIHLAYALETICSNLATRVTPSHKIKNPKYNQSLYEPSSDRIREVSQFIMDELIPAMGWKVSREEESVILSYQCANTDYFNLFMLRD